MNVSKIGLACCLSAAVVGCSNMSSTEKRTLEGTGIGTASGALIGGLATGQPLHGAVIGAAAGAVGGYFLYKKKKKTVF